MDDFPGQLLEKEFSCFQGDAEKMLWPYSTRRKKSAVDMHDTVREKK